MKRALTLGTRGSRLARIQTQQVADQLRALAPGLDVAVAIISTRGDEVRDRPLVAIGDKGLFTKELEQALRDRRIDLAVHSMKDLQSVLPEDLALGAVPPRENPADALVAREWPDLDALPQGARVGTSSLRRKAQLLAYRRDLEIVDLRGNIDTRLRRVQEGALDAAVLALAGLARLGRADAVTQVLPPEVMLPAVGQGALAVEIRADDKALRELLRPLTDPAALAEVTAERALLAALEGGCQVPIGALARVQGASLELRGCVCRPDGSEILHTEVRGAAEAAEDLGRRAAEDLLDRGARGLMEVRR